jgi:lactate dehydrogenase-like 2-hydroxyacid dehydrogenase
MGDVMRVKLFDLTGKRIYVAGHRGMVGSAIVRRLAAYRCDVITADREEADLERQEQTEAFLSAAKPDVVVVAAAKVGGIHANDAYPAEFIGKNLRKLLDSSKLIEMGWRARTALRKGLELTYSEFLAGNCRVQ